MKTENEKLDAENNSDLEQIFNYPSLGELFSDSDPQRVADFCARLENRRRELESIIRRGQPADAARAERAVKGLETTLNFLRELHQKRQNPGR